ncbi:MAG: nitrogen regulation protein NR(I) [Gammaproteobacteria bacterium]|jgi:two-component system nitrogen regulation response regulator GlnG|nr:nitrogen regulation protein NR(I) [Gammaproteobacteria bacterium]|tara:strand:+ start:2543 stop:3976 length:1434 start_codon:yes stop_codon:yes gene_type:complete
MSTANRVWVADDEKSIRWVLDKALSKEGISVTCFESAEALLTEIDSGQPDVVVSDIRMGGMDGLALLSRLREQHPDVPVIVMTAHSDLDSAVASIQGGAFEYIPKPFEVDEAVSIVKRALIEHTRATSDPAAPSQQQPAEIIGKAPAMQEVFRAIGRLSKSNVTVLINGQSGTGKELVANALHRHSMRKDGPFVALNMAAIPQDLIESELFGHEKGAFTGANQARVGRFEQARGGTLFLDEIGDMPAEAQTRLLRVLSDGKYYRVGGHEPLEADVRIIAATHQNLETLVSDNRFREDLFHRLNVIRIHLPNLYDRSEDIPMLLEHFLAEAARELGEEMKVIPEDTMNFLVSLPWQGNVRQLENFSRWITVMATGREVLLDDLPLELRSNSEQPEQSDQLWDRQLRKWAQAKLKSRTFSGDGLLAEAQPLFERIMIEAALDETAGRKRDASLLLGWGRNTLTRKMQELGMDQGNASEG